MRRHRRRTLTPHQQRLANTLHTALLLVDVTSEGLSVCMRRLMDMDDFNRVRSLMDGVLEPALRSAAEAQKIYDDSLKRRTASPKKRNPKG